MLNSCSWVRDSLLQVKKEKRHFKYRLDEPINKEENMHCFSRLLTHYMRYTCHYRRIREPQQQSEHLNSKHSIIVLNWMVHNTYSTDFFFILLNMKPFFRFEKVIKWISATVREYVYVSGFQPEFPSTWSIELVPLLMYVSKWLSLLYIYMPFSLDLLVLGFDLALIVTVI